MKDDVDSRRPGGSASEPGAPKHLRRPGGSASEPGAPKDLPARIFAAATRDALERVLLSLRTLPESPPREDLAAKLRTCLASITRWGESGLDDVQHLEWLGRAQDEVRQACEIAQRMPGGERRMRGLVSVARALDRGREATIDRLVANQQHLLRDAPSEIAGRTPTPIFRASVGLPTLHVLRPLFVDPHLEPGGEVDDEEESPPDIADVLRGGADIEEEVEEALAPLAADPPSLEDVQLSKLARDAFEDIAVLSTLRRRNDDEPWHELLRFEQRMLDNLDDLIALTCPEPGVAHKRDLLPELLRYASEGGVPDKGRAFCRAFVLGCLEGDDAIRAAVFALRQSEPATYEAQREALCLAPHPGTGDAARRLLSDARPALTCTALETLRFRRENVNQAVLLLAHPSPNVRVSAARALSVGSSAVVQPLRMLTMDPTASDELRLAAAESLLHHGALAGLLCARAEVATRVERGGEMDTIGVGWLRLLALAGAAGDRDALAKAARMTVRLSDSGAGSGDGFGAVSDRGDALVDDRARRRELHAPVRLLGWHGHATAITALLEMLDAAADITRDTGGLPSERHIAIVEALFRVTGAPLFVEDRDIPDTVATTRLSLDPSTWRAFLAEHDAHFARAIRFRFGRPYTPFDSLTELEGTDTPIADRRDAAFEVAVLARGRSRLELDDWTVRQRSCIDELRSAFEGDAALRHAPGDFAGGVLLGRS